MNITSIWNSVYPVLVAILFFELIIVIHEWGHFTAARLMKIKVNEFSVGMGPKLLQHKGKKTTYTLRLILFGGYCSMEGEDKESDDENAFVNKKVWQSIDGMRVYTTNDVTTGFSRCSNENVNLVVERDGKDVKLKVKFNTEDYEGHTYTVMDFWLRGVKKTPANVISQTGKEFVSYARMVFLSLHDLLVGRYGISDMSGPVGTVSVVSTAVKTSMYSMLRIIALLTVNVGGVFNQCCRSCGTSFIDVLCNLQRYNKIVLNLNSGDCYGKKKK